MRNSPSTTFSTALLPMVSWIEIQSFFTYLANNCDCHERPFMNLIFICHRNENRAGAPKACNWICALKDPQEKVRENIYRSKPDLKVADTDYCDSHYCFLLYYYVHKKINQSNHMLQACNCAGKWQLSILNSQACEVFTALEFRYFRNGLSSNEPLDNYISLLADGCASH